MTQRMLRHLADSIDGEVHTDDGTRAAYASDASNHRVVPQAVVFPRSVDDTATTVRECAEAGVPITSRGAGTNVAGNAIGPGVIIEFSRHLNRVLSVDPDTRTAVAEPGVVLDRLQQSASPHGLRFGPDPSTHSRCTIAGMVGTNACGSRSVAAFPAFRQAAVRIRLVDGQEFSCGPLTASGDPDDPLSDVDVLQKFRGYAARVSHDPDQIGRMLLDHAPRPLEEVLQPLKKPITGEFPEPPAMLAVVDEQSLRH